MITIDQDAVRRAVRQLLGTPEEPGPTSAAELVEATGGTIADIEAGLLGAPFRAELVGGLIGALGSSPTAFVRAADGYAILPDATIDRFGESQAQLSEARAANAQLMSEVGKHVLEAEAQAREIAALQTQLKLEQAQRAAYESQNRLLEGFIKEDQKLKAEWLERSEARARAPWYQRIWWAL